MYTYVHDVYITYHQESEKYYMPKKTTAEKNTTSNSVPHTFRMPDEVYEQFVKFTESQNITQGSALALLLKTYEMEANKQRTPGREVEVEQFQHNLNQIMEGYLYSLQVCSDTEARVREDVRKEMDSLKQTIVTYQADAVQLTTELAEANEKINILSVAAEEVESLRSALQAVEKEKEASEKSHAGQIDDKNRIIITLEEKLTAAEQQAAGIAELHNTCTQLANNLKAAQEAALQQQRTYEREQERAAWNAEKKLNDAVEEAKNVLLVEIEALKEDLHAAELKARTTETDHTTELRALENQCAASLRVIEAEKARLRELLIINNIDPDTGNQLQTA